MTPGERLAQFCRLRRLSPTAVAEHARLSVPTITEAIAGRRRFTGKSAEAVAEAFQPLTMLEADLLAMAAGLEPDAFAHLVAPEVDVGGEAGTLLREILAILPPGIGLDLLRSLHAALLHTARLPPDQAELLLKQAAQARMKVAKSGTEKTA